MEHLPRKLSLNNDISSAPQKFQVRGLSHPHDKSSHHFGDYRYNDTGTALQYFNVKVAVYTKKVPDLLWEVLILPKEQLNFKKCFACGAFMKIKC